ncbi:hypothetical protein SpiGrapes_2912 [Sphaerochaeta pleomorpha str. Grapes]|uniref:TP-1001-like C-terminal domain-containing protein n=2 Tax=Sphaerochaeta TaxID=399320 RepID=G8QX77_SPHPG|nr:hypothetical protein SpiGrapes_2912 [Sphaerochaeta pleomorpha str. Grapes]
MYSILLALFLFIATGCGCNHASPTITDLFSMQDSTPPVLLSATAINPSTLFFQFDEPIEAKTCMLNANGRAVTQYLCNGKDVTVSLSNPMALATFCTIEGRVEDRRGNSCRFTTEVWAKNTHRAHVLINEFSTKGTENNPDRVELLVTKGGNLAGITLANGIGLNYTDRCILPDKTVSQGTFIVISFQKGIVKEAFCSENLAGLSGNNGCIVVSETPQFDSPLLDAVLYGNLTTTTFNGFGSSDLEKSAQSLCQCGQWDTVLASGSIDSTYSTSTRSVCREKERDTNTLEDWYVTETRMATFGARNSDAHYEKAE